MSLWVIGFLAIRFVMLATFVAILVQAFRTYSTWGFGLLLLFIGPIACGFLHAPLVVAGVVALVGLTVLLSFVIRNWSKAGVFFLIYLAGFVGSLALMFTSPPVMAFYSQYNPRFAQTVKTVNPRAYDEAQKLSPTGDKSTADKSPGGKPTPREVRDLAENETPEPTPFVDLNATQRAAYAKHAKELNSLYQQLDAERPKLKPGSPAVAAFNAKAAHYQQGLQTLAEEKSRLDALDHASHLNTDAATALASLQTSAQNGDYETFAATLKKSLSEYRQTPSFPQIVAFARTSLQQATPDKVLAGLQAKASVSAREDCGKTTKQIQGIVNQVPQIVPKPPEATDVFHYSFHDGANKPDLKAENLLGTRELWKGQYVYMDEAPGVFYRGGDCEFNPQTKFFYTSRNVPKKRLSDLEYKELTRLYHQLGQQEKAVASVPPPTKDAERVSSDLTTLKAQLDGYAMK